MIHDRTGGRMNTLFFLTFRETDESSIFQSVQMDALRSVICSSYLITNNYDYWIYVQGAAFTFSFLAVWYRLSSPFFQDRVR